MVHVFNLVKHQVYSFALLNQHFKLTFSVIRASCYLHKNFLLFIIKRQIIFINAPRRFL